MARNGSSSWPLVVHNLGRLICSLHSLENISKLYAAPPGPDDLDLAQMAELFPTSTPLSEPSFYFVATSPPCRRPAARLGTASARAGPHFRPDDARDWARNADFRR